MKSILSRSSTSLLVAIAASTSFVSVPSVRAALVVYEGFGYTPTTAILGQNGGSGFNAAWANGGSFNGSSTISAGSLVYGGTAALPSSGNSGLNPVPDNVSYPAVSRNFTPVTTGDLWVSFLFTCSNPSAGYSYFRLQDGTLNNYVFSFQAFAGDNSDQTVFILNSLNTSTTINANQVYLLTLRLQNIGSETSLVSLFLNDNLTTPILTDTRIIAQIGGLDFISGPNAYQGSGGNFTSGIDEIRVGTTLADVSAIPEPTVLGLLGIAGLALVSRRRRQS